MYQNNDFGFNNIKPNPEFQGTDNVSVTSMTLSWKQSELCCFPVAPGGQLVNKD